jgi:uncharacterized cupredoxin-like copper-binding protein
MSLKRLLAPAILAIAILSLGLVACGDDDDDDTTANASPSATMVMDDEHEESFSFGHPADASEADRTIEIEALDTLKYDPADDITVHVGETITFKVQNSGQLEHEFGLGTEEDQADHEQEMQEMATSGMAMHDDPNAFAMMSGETKELTWTFTEPGTVLYGCHVAGHYAAGMKGTITVE